MSVGTHHAAQLSMQPDVTLFIKTKFETGKWPKSLMIPERYLKPDKKWCNLTFSITINYPNERIAVILIMGFTLLSNYSCNVPFSIPMQICAK